MIAPNWEKHWANIKLSGFLLLGIFLGTLGANTFLTGEILPTLEVWSKLTGIIGGLSIAIAAMSFFYQRQHDLVESVIDQLRFFRVDILDSARKHDSDVEAIFPTISRNRMPIRAFDETVFMQDYPEMYKTQYEILINPKHKELNDRQLSLLNMLEEFSLRVINTGGAYHPALSSVRDSFLSTVERSVVAMLNLAKEEANGPYKGVRQLYSLWNSFSKEPL